MVITISERSLFMDKWLGLDSKFYKWGTLLGDLIIITLLWLVCSIPVFTIGASTTALYYVTTRQLSNREGYVTRDFFKSFKQNFLEATAVTFIIGILLAIVYINLSFFNPDTTISVIIYLIQYVILYEIIIFTIYVFPVLSRFDLKLGALIKTSFFMANRHLLTTITCAILFVAIVMIFKKCGILIILCAGVYGILTSLMFMKLFRKYVPDMDKDKPEDMV